MSGAENTEFQGVRNKNCSLCDVLFTNDHIVCANIRHYTCSEAENHGWKLVEDCNYDDDREDAEILKHFCRECSLNV